MSQAPVQPPVQASTRDRILMAAETLFAERGFAETSMRLITTCAGVNLASVNYHFGSKKDLIQAVFDRFLQSLTESLQQEMAALARRRGRPSVEAVLATFMKPLQGLNALEPDGAVIFMRLLGRAYAETQGHLRRFISDRYGHVLTDFVALLQRAHPDVPADAVFWRLHFMLGVLVFAIGGSNALAEIAEADFDQAVTLDGVIEKLIPFLAAGFRAPLTFSPAGELR